VPSPGITACLPKASGRATITTGRLNDTMKVTITGMPPKAGFDLFVIQTPNTPFKLGCEPGATSPVVTPFNGEQNAGIQLLNTANFPDNTGPLSHVHR
jgi:hypothetical protein